MRAQGERDEAEHIENFEELPVLKTGPYDYGLGYIAEEDPDELYEHGVPIPAAT